MTPDVHLLPRWCPLGGFAWGGAIWLKHPDWPEDVRHEEVHLAQQAKLGQWRFLWRYLTSATFRVEAEAPAYVAEGYTAAQVPALLYHWWYLWCLPLGRAGIERVVQGVMRGG